MKARAGPGDAEGSVTDHGDKDSHTNYLFSWCIEKAHLHYAAVYYTRNCIVGKNITYAP